MTESTLPRNLRGDCAPMLKQSARIKLEKLGRKALIVLDVFAGHRVDTVRQEEKARKTFRVNPAHQCTTSLYQNNRPPPPPTTKLLWEQPANAKICGLFPLRTIKDL